MDDKRLPPVHDPRKFRNSLDLFREAFHTGSPERSFCRMAIPRRDATVCDALMVVRLLVDGARRRRREMFPRSRL